MIKKALIAVAVLVAVLAIAAAVAVWMLRSSGLPDRDGEHPLPGLDAEVSVRWDRWGVPHVAAESEEDLLAALGWLHANDRLTQMELGRRAAAGRLAEVLGEPLVEIDVYFRTLRLAETAEAIFEGSSPRSRRWLEAYAAGVDAWLAERGSDLPPGLRLLGVEPEPWRPEDSVAFALLMAEDLSFYKGRPEEDRFRWLGTFGVETVRDLLDQPDLHPVPAILELATGTAPSDDATAPETASPGSNNWAVGGSLTASGKAMVANDPHLGLHLPSVWYQVHLRSPTYRAAGMTLPGAPGVVLGRGPHVAWAFTNTMLDDHDLFFERLDDGGEKYLRGDRWLPVETRQEEIPIRGGGSHTLTLRATDRGPLLDADPARGLPPRSLAWSAHHPGDPIAALAEIAGASTPEELMAAVEPYVAPAQNLVAAFEDGRLAFTAIGRVPLRRGPEASEAPRWLGRLPAPGWDPAYRWDGFRPRDSNPTIVDPADDRLVTANHDVRPPGYPLPLVAEFYTPHRARRIAERLAEDDRWTAEKLAELQTDVTSLFARELVAALGDGDAFEGDAHRGWEALQGWDGTMAVEGPAALFILLERNLIRAIFADEMEAAGLPPFGDRDRALALRILRGDMDERWYDDVTTDARESRSETVGNALAEAWREGAERWGDDVAGWDYGWLHPLTLRHRLDAVPLFGGWLRRGPYPLPGSATTVAAFGAAWRGDRHEVTYGPSMRWIVDWGNPESGLAGLPGGQSGHGADPHYDDQIEPYLAGDLHPAPWSEAAVEAAAVSVLRLLPEGK